MKEVSKICYSAMIVLWVMMIIRAVAAEPRRTDIQLGKEDFEPRNGTENRSNNKRIIHDNNEDWYYD